MVSKETPEAQASLETALDQRNARAFARALKKGADPNAGAGPAQTTLYHGNRRLSAVERIVFDELGVEFLQIAARITRLEYGVKTVPALDFAFGEGKTAIAQKLLELGAPYGESCWSAALFGQKPVEAANLLTRYGKPSERLLRGFIYMARPEAVERAMPWIERSGLDLWPYLLANTESSEATQFLHKEKSGGERSYMAVFAALKRLDPERLQRTLETATQTPLHLCSVERDFAPLLAEPMLAALVNQLDDQGRTPLQRHMEKPRDGLALMRLAQRGPVVAELLLAAGAVAPPAKKGETQARYLRRIGCGWAPEVMWKKGTPEASEPCPTAEKLWQAAQLSLLEKSTPAATSQRCPRL